MRTNGVAAPAGGPPCPRAARRSPCAAHRPSAQRPDAPGAGVGGPSPRDRRRAVAARGRPGRVRRADRQRARPRSARLRRARDRRRPGRVGPPGSAGTRGRRVAGPDDLLGDARPPVGRGHRGTFPLLRGGRPARALPELAALPARPRLRGGPSRGDRNTRAGVGVQPRRRGGLALDVGADPRRLRAGRERRQRHRVEAQRTTPGGDRPLPRAQRIGPPGRRGGHLHAGRRRTGHLRQRRRGADPRLFGRRAAGTRAARPHPPHHRGGSPLPRRGLPSLRLLSRRPPALG